LSDRKWFPALDLRLAGVSDQQCEQSLSESSASLQSRKRQAFPSNPFNEQMGENSEQLRRSGDSVPGVTPDHSRRKGF
jgi:hypothetical protein